MHEYGKSPKRLVIRSIEHLHAKLLVKLQENRIKQHAFFVEFINGFINDDPIINQWIDNNPNLKRGKRSQSIRRMEDKKMKKIEDDLNLEQKELDELFDILEEDEKLGD